MDLRPEKYNIPYRLSSVKCSRNQDILSCNKLSDSNLKLKHRKRYITVNFEWCEVVSFPCHSKVKLCGYHYPPYVKLLSIIDTTLREFAHQDILFLHLYDSSSSVYPIPCRLYSPHGMYLLANIFQLLPSTISVQVCLSWLAAVIPKNIGWDSFKVIFTLKKTKLCSGATWVQK